MPKKITKYHPIDIYVGKKLRKIRTKSNISLETLGQSVDLSGEQIRKYEGGANRISASKLFQIGSFFGKNVSFFFENYKVGSKKNKQLALRQYQQTSS